MRKETLRRRSDSVNFRGILMIFALDLNRKINEILDISYFTIDVQ